MADRRPLSIQESTYFVGSNSFRGGPTSLTSREEMVFVSNNDVMRWYKRLLRTIGISEQWTLLCEQKNVNQSSDFPKSTAYCILNGLCWFQILEMGLHNCRILCHWVECGTLNLSLICLLSLLNWNRLQLMDAFRWTVWTNRCSAMLQLLCLVVRVLARNTKGRGFDSRPFHF